MREREISESLIRRLGATAAVALLGARQVGKTTLAKAIGRQQGAVYIDLESPSDLVKLHDAEEFFALHADKLIILDEIQYKPELFPILRGVIDRNRERGHRVGQFLLLGSASMDLLRQSSESLAGRISYLQMSGFNCVEVEGDDLRQLWHQGGFPESFLAPDSEVAMDWLEDLIRTYLERDIPQLGFKVPSSKLRRLWTMLAHLQGESVNMTQLGANLEIDRREAAHYADILVDLLLVRRLQPWFVNVKKRLIKSPRYYLRDSGILHRLLGIDTYEDLLSHPVLGKSWEGFVIENIHSVLPMRAETFYYRTSAGAELDLVIRFSADEVWAVEIKYGSAPKLSRSFEQSCQDVQATQKYVVYGGEEQVPIGNGALLLPLADLLRKIQDRTAP